MKKPLLSGAIYNMDKLQIEGALRAMWKAPVPSVHEVEFEKRHATDGRVTLRIVRIENVAFGAQYAYALDYSGLPPGRMWEIGDMADLVDLIMSTAEDYYTERQATS